jgi:hypothetical protein
MCLHLLLNIDGFLQFDAEKNWIRDFAALSDQKLERMSSGIILTNIS